jgi:hypothetical protein
LNADAMKRALSAVAAAVLVSIIAILATLSASLALAEDFKTIAGKDSVLLLSTPQ